MLFIGISYGFHHNDLHMGNIIYNLKTDKLAIIDFGRSTFLKYTTPHIEDKKINNKLLCEIEKLNLKNIPHLNKLLSGVNTYRDLFNINKTYGLFHDTGYNNFNVYGENIIYPMIIFDLIQLCLSIYLSLKTILKHSDKFFIHFNKIIKEENGIFIINGNNNTLEILLNNYIDICNFIYSIPDTTLLKKTYKIILDGILLLGLLCIYFNAINDTTKIIHHNLSFKGTLRDKQHFIVWLTKFYDVYKDSLFVTHNHFLSNIYESNIYYDHIIKTKIGGLSNTTTTDISKINEKIFALSLEDRKQQTEEIEQKEEIEETEQIDEKEGNELNNMYYNTYIIKNNKFKLTTNNINILDYVIDNFKIDTIELQKLVPANNSYTETLIDIDTYNTEELSKLISKCNSTPDLEKENKTGGKNKKIRKLKTY
jgi:hypothetical protein